MEKDPADKLASFSPLDSAGQPPAAPKTPVGSATQTSASQSPGETASGPAPLDNELVRRANARFGAAILEATIDRKQAILLIAADQLAEIARYLCEDEKFRMLTDLTAVDWPQREKQFDVVVNLYSFAKNERLRLKTHVAESERVPSLCGIWPAANWLERECFDMFGIVFDGHPDMRRILLPEEWQGHPLRKDYDILQQDTAWVRANLKIESGQ